MSTRLPTVIGPATTEGPLQPTLRTALEHLTLVNGECAAQPHKTYPT